MTGFKRRALAIAGVAALALGLASVPAQAADSGTSNIPAVTAADSARLTPPTATSKNSSAEKSSKLVTSSRHGVPAKKSGVSTNSLTSGYHYAYAQETPAAAQQSLMTTSWVAKPNDYGTDHSLWEMTVQGGTNNRQFIIELGWAVEPNAFPTPSTAKYNPHLFSSIWVNDTWCGSYVGAGSCGTFVNYNDPAGDVNLGDDLTDYLGTSHVNAVGTGKRFAIQYQATGCGTIGGVSAPGWWINYDNKWIGCYQLNSWTSATPSMTPTNATFFQSFGEVYKHTPSAGCDQMGNGVFPATTSTITAYWSALTHSPSGGPAWTGGVLGATDPTQYGVLFINATSARYGGTESSPC